MMKINSLIIVIFCSLVLLSCGTDKDEDVFKGVFFENMGSSATKSIAIGGIASSSSGANPSAAFDGNLATAWNSGRYAPVWIAVDLRQTRTINRVRLTPSQLPDGNTTHQISVSSDMTNWRVVDNFTLFTRSQVAFERTFTSPIGNVRGIRVTTTQSPSWVAWYEIEVFGN